MLLLPIEQRNTLRDPCIVFSPLQIERSTSETSSGFLKMSFITTDRRKARFGQCPKIPSPVLVGIYRENDPEGERYIKLVLVLFSRR